ncbi:hypothetical protein AVEN_46529-1 [Araneus ventricosus]|uniref:Integrase catalytic domain-containing protein n=1 Tax=Araneus ventricosus TaxID=182803 RepID=A0A4Y2D3N1_ARAVE|nr:hypothetical protein AVEN_46529-1 [Araneus ventricosus]
MGFPREIQCDNGTSFTSQLTTEFFERFGIKVTHSSVHHPQSNPVERFHRTLKRLLKVLCLQSGEDWEKNLPATLLALRTVTHESTGFSPAELVHGKNLRTPEVLLYEHCINPQESESSVTEYVFELINKMRRCQDLAVERMTEVQVKRKAWYDKNAVRRKFQVGDQVLLVLATSKPNKMAVQWTGPGVLENCESFAVPYLDDIAIYSNNWEDHLKHVNEVLKRIGDANLTIKPSKCKFAQNRTKYLGHVVGSGVRTPAEAKIKAVLDFPTPTSKTQIRAFLWISWVLRALC